MGIIVGKLRRKKSTYDILQKLENEITSIEEFQKNTAQTQRKIIYQFVILAVLIYIILAIFVYLYFSQVSVNQKFMCIIPLIGVPLILWVIKRVLTWYYNRKIRKNENKLSTLKEQKKKIINNVMETETYKVAKKILDKFGNDKIKAIIPVESTPLVNTRNSLVPSIRLNESALRQRTIAAQSSMRSRISFGGYETPAPEKRLPMQSQPLSIVPSTGPRPATPLQPPRGILPRDRSALEKMVDYLVGDGPSNRYALICKKCSSHNGMALKEEFEYLSFRCCYCSAFNPSRKKKPVGPTFVAKSSLSSPSKRSETSDSDRSSQTDSDSESSKPIVTEPRSESPDTGKTSDFDKLSDLDLKSSDNDASPMEIDPPVDKETADDSSNNSSKTVINSDENVKN